MKCAGCQTENKKDFDSDDAKYCVSCEETNAEILSEENLDAAGVENSDDAAEESDENDDE